jgi:DNA-directed RNA polymerase specialized sigma subunit
MDIQEVTSSSEEISSSSSESIDQESQPISNIDKVLLATKLINDVIDSVEDERERYALKFMVEVELSEVLGLYTDHYRPATPLENGNRPSQ